MLELREAIEIEAPPEQVFGVLHDFGKRLSWDQGMAAARLTNAESAKIGARTQCVARWIFGKLEVSFEYVELAEGVLAALKMVRRPWLVRELTAVVEHRRSGVHDSVTSYRIRAVVGPKWLRWLLEPMAGAVLGWETRRRLRGLKRYVEAADSGK